MEPCLAHVPELDPDLHPKFYKSIELHPSTPGYWWTCAAHAASPATRILAPADEVTVQPFIGAPLRNAPWPETANGLLNGSLASRELDSSYLGNIAYTGDYFLRIPPERRKGPYINNVRRKGEGGGLANF